MEKKNGVTNEVNLKRDRGKERTKEECRRAGTQ